MKTTASIALFLTVSFLSYPPFARGSQTASLDDSESESKRKKEAVGIVGFAFKYTGLDHPCIGNILPEGPAATLDIKSGDLLMAIDGKDTALLSIQGARQLLLGKPGSKVTITLRSPSQENKSIALTRMSSSAIKDKRMRQMIEHARERHTKEEAKSAPLIICQMSEPGPSVLEFYTKQSGQNKLLLEEEKHGLSVKHIAIDDTKNAKLKALLQIRGSAPVYYFAGILTTLGHFERRPLTSEILANHLKSINWTPGQDSLHQAMIAQYEAMRNQSWQPGSQNQRAILLNSDIANPRREEAIAAICRYIQLHNSSNKGAKSMLAPEALALGLPPMDKLIFENSHDNINIVGDSFAVARTTLSNPLPLNVYFYLRRNRDWKITAARALACTGPLNAIVSQLEKKSQLTDEENSTLKNLKLTLSTDSELKNWFKVNKPALEELVSSGASLAAGSSVILNDSRPKLAAALDSASIKEKLQALHLSGLSKVDDKQMEVVIGGVTDNTVGFLYAPDNKPPLIGPTEYIWVEKVADNWYLFRTT
ncbi:hypothetical protein KBI23_11285 [bacterium]|nr:hypothetical protein [bacterium]MBP9809210.1 hypothetical protein [bacterium]